MLTGRHTMTDGRRGSQRLRPTILLAASDIVLHSCCTHGRKIHVNGDVSRLSRLSLALLHLHSIRGSAVTCSSRLRPLNVGLLLFVERETSAA